MKRGFILLALPCAVLAEDNVHLTKKADVAICSSQVHAECEIAIEAEWTFYPEVDYVTRDFECQIYHYSNPALSWPTMLADENVTLPEQYQYNDTRSHSGRIPYYFPERTYCARVRGLYQYNYTWRAFPIEYRRYAAQATDCIGPTVGGGSGNQNP